VFLRLDDAFARIQNPPIMILQRIFGFIVKRCSYLVVLLGLAVYGYIQRHSPRQPDPASGHVFRVIAPRSRRMPRRILYLTSSERSLYHASFIVIFVGTFGILGHLAMVRKRNSAPSSG
jgi:hypothetical protein